MRVLIACECSGVVRRAFAARGHDAWSCDLVPAWDGSPNHLQCDALHAAYSQHWDLMIAHPPCTVLALSAAWAFKDGPYHQKLKPGTLTGAARRKARVESIAFVDALWKAPVARVVIENPRGFLSTMWEPPTQTIQPYDFGDDASKATCLWIRGAPMLTSTSYAPPRHACMDCGAHHKAAGACSICGAPADRVKARWSNQTDAGQNKLPPSDDRAALRSETYPGIAKALAAQLLR